MPVNLSVKNVPDHIAERLRQRAAKHHRSLQGELIAILEENVTPKRSLNPLELLSEVRAFALNTPEESADFIRKERDVRLRR
jgi:plasmid stability protein